MAKVLLIDDDLDHNQMVSTYLKREGYLIECVNSGADAQHMLTTYGYDLIIMDWNLPDMTGPEILKWYRQRGNTPVIMLTGRGTIADREKGLDSGADDYLIKPFSARELAARMRAVLRRPPAVASDVLEVGEYVLNVGTFSVTKGDDVIKLPPREFALLEFLARHPNEVFKGDVLMARVWHSDSEANTDTLRTAIKQIRKRLHDGVIETVAGAGYMLGK